MRVAKLRAMLKVIGRWLLAVFGRVSWEPAPWMKAARLPAWSKNRRLWIALLLTLIAGIAGRELWLRRPRPVTPDSVTVSIVAPTPPPPRRKADAAPPPAPLRLRFGRSVAPLDRVGKELPVADAPTVNPDLAGRWRWDSESDLTFVPTAPWPIGTHYTVRLSSKQVTANVVVVNPELGFNTEPFSARWINPEFYQDPVDPNTKQAVGTLRFNYPVDAATLEARLSITSRPSNETGPLAKLRHTVTYDDLRYEAYVRTESLSVPLVDHVAMFHLAPGVAPQATGNTTTTALEAQVMIPGRSNLFRIEHVSASLARDEQQDPLQILVVATRSPIHEQRLAAAVQAWVLPRDPKLPNDAAKIGPEILKRSRALTLRLIPGEREISQAHTLGFEAAAGSTVLVRIDKGLEAFGGYVLAQTFATVLTVPEFPREVRISHDGAILSLSGEKKLTVVARGLKAVRVTLSRVQPKDLNHLVTMSSGDIAHLRMGSHGFGEENVSEVFSEIRPLDPSDARHAQYVAVDFGPYLRVGGELRGLYFLKVEGWDPERQQAITSFAPTHEVVGGHDEGDGDDGDDVGEVSDVGDEPPDQEETPEDMDESGEGDEPSPGFGQTSDRRFVLLTDLGVLEKIDATRSRWVFVQSFRSGQPVEKASVDVLAKNGTVLLSRSSDAAGVAQLPPLDDFKAEKTPVALVVRSGQDVAVLPLNRAARALELSRFDVGGVRTRGKSAALDAFVFSDRGLYRPGETIHVAAIVKAVDWSRSVSGIPLRIAVTDPRGLEVKAHRLSLPASGFVEASFTPELNAPTGSYTFGLYIAEDKKAPLVLGSTTARVEEFLPDQMRITARLGEGATAGWEVAQNVPAHIELRTLFGAPAAKHRISATLSLRPAAPSFPSLKDYTFADPARAQRSFEEALPDAETDDAGRAQLDVDLSRFAAGSYRVELLAEGFELAGGRSVSTQASLWVSPRKYLLGYKSDGTLGYVHRGAERKVELIAVDPKLARVEVGGLSTVLVEQRYVSVLVREPNGSYRYQSILKDLTRSTKPLKIGRAGTTLNVPTDTAGSFYFSVREGEVELTRIPFTVAGEGNAAMNLERNSELQVVLNQHDFEPGASIELQITAPYAGSGVITIERDRVYVHKTFTTTSQSTTQTIQVPADLAANGYVCVAFVRAIDSTEVYASPLSYAAVPFTISRAQQTLGLKVTAPTESKPGRKLTMSYSTDRPAHVVVFAVDEGILQVAQYRTPDPLAHFLAKRALEVSTHQMLDLLLPEFKLVSERVKQGGDSDEEALGKNLNPFRRQVDLPAVFWSGIVPSGPEAKQVTFDVPDSFNGTLRVMTIGVAPDALAAFETRSVVRAPFVIEPSLPLFVAPGDTFTVSAAVANTVAGSGKKTKVEVGLTTSEGLRLSDAAPRTLEISEGTEELVTFEVKAEPKLGDASLRFAAHGAKQESVRTVHLSVRPSSPYEVVTAAQSLKSGRAELPVARQLHEAYARRELDVSVLPLGIAQGAVAYLENYPHLCTEQLVSQAMPALVFSKHPEWGIVDAQAKEKLGRTAAILQTRQNDEGAFGFWAANSFVSDFQVIYAAHFLTEAADRGLPAALEIRRKALAYVKTVAERPLSSESDARLRAYGLYVLARNGTAMAAQTADLAEFLRRRPGKGWEQDVTSAYLAATYLLTRDDEQARAWISGFKLTAQVSSDPRSFHDQSTYDPIVLYLVARHFPARLFDLEAPLLERITKVISADGLHSLNSAMSLLALDAYSSAVLAKTGGLGLDHVRAEELDAQGKSTPLRLEGSVVARARVSASAKSVRVVAGDGPPVYLSLMLAGFDRQPAPESQGKLEVHHAYEDDQGRPVTQVALGQEIVVRTRVRAFRSTSQVAVVDLLPAGFDVVLQRGSDAQGLRRLGGGTSTWSPEYLDVREDRINFYGTATDRVQEFTYRIKAIARGNFGMPPAFAQAMYEPSLRARGSAGSIQVR